MFVKICGLKTELAVAAAVEAGADAVGFVFAESPRQVTPAHARDLCRELPPSIARVAVMLRPSADEWNEVRDVFAPDWLQTEAEDFGRLDIPEQTGRLPVYRDKNATDFELADIDWPGHILFEGARSGVGLQPNWHHAAQIARKTCLVLAGGLDPDNVHEAIVQVRPWGVDVSSGVEQAPGIKDPVRIAAFVKAAREASEI